MNGDEDGAVHGGPGGPDRPGRPGGADAWDARSEEWLLDPTDEGPGGSPSRTGSARTAAAVAETRTTTAGRAPAPRRGAADPVKALLHRHRALCEQAVDPLEIAAGLEAHGVTDRTAARFRHRDVFSLAEELYARVPRDGDGDRLPPAQPPPAPRVRADRILLPLLPGVVGAAVVTGVRLTEGRPRLLTAAVGLLALVLAVRAALRHGPLAAPALTRHPATGTRAWTCWLLAYALLGNGLLRAVLDGGPGGLPTGAAHGPWPVTTAPVLALALAFAPAAWSVHLLAAAARRRLAASRGLAEFAGAVRPLLLGTFALCLGALTALLALCAAVLDEPAGYPEALTLGALLLLARLLAVHHVPQGTVLALAAAGEAAAVGLVLAGRLPGCAFLASPVDALAGAWGPGGVPALVCGAAALVLLVRATRTLTRAPAHAPPGDPR
ncbi:hypothetical protein QZN11_35630 [Streptomyces gramineus]|uniref:hypothetical protein n=1 Tax=Streptomyces gramineus TaxID=910542 RepID=UPI00398B6CF8